MERIEHAIEIAKSSQQMPLLMMLLAGLFIARCSYDIKLQEGGVVGDNIPTTLLEGLRR